MTDSQILTVAIAIVVPLSLLLYSNSRISEAKETLRAEMQVLRAEMNALRADMNAGFERISTQLKIHELEHHK
jgi:hypothetical protein